jgi:hypothetical protein
VVVPFAPSDTVKTLTFAQHITSPATSFLAGPWQSPGHLATPGTITFYRAGAPPPLEPGYHPLTIEDAAAYSAGIRGQSQRRVCR